eukprot:TRINITY_DN2658_c0_g2_i1.p1 TRINITY_DN2658_c0_g2~~TRINITY_DN2658_c0_g2_i1.p1  ORF type:complete len:678 (-),score=240.16 TRINITY_DN2658_c0_g2_i1:43-2028(-)
MAAQCAIIAALLCGSLVQATKLHFNLAEAKKRPTTKVVELLKGMQDQLELEAAEDAKTYDNFKCWCKKNSEEKGASVKAAQRSLKEKQLHLEELVSKAQRLKDEVEKAENEMLAKGNELTKQQTVRAHEHKVYNEEKARLTSEMQGVDDAKKQLSGSTGLFLQKSWATQASTLVQRLIERHAEKLSSHERVTLEVFQEDPATGVNQVNGILQGMHDDYAGELESIDSTEKNQSAAFKQLEAALEEEIEAGRVQIENKNLEKVDTNEERAHLKNGIKDILAEIGDDAAFADEIKKQCADMDAQWDKRSATRAEESEAISKAIETLDSDDAHESFSKTAPSFLQQSESATRRQLAAEALGKASQRDARLADLAEQMKIDSFTKVKKAMDDMVAALKKEQQDEIQHKEQCVKSLRVNDIDIGDKTRAKESLVAKENTLEVKVDEASKDIATLEKDIKNLQEQLAIASQDREAENKEFQRIIPEQRETQRLLKQALKVLARFYNKKGFFVQVSASSQQPKAPAGFKEYKTNGHANGVMGMLQQLISDSEIQEAEASAAEAGAQKAYEKFAKATQDSVDAKETELSDTKAAKAKTEHAALNTRKSREGTVKELESLNEVKADLHEECDWLLANFDARQDARAEEMDSVEKAKAILSGAKFAEIQLN